MSSLPAGFTEGGVSCLCLSFSEKEVLPHCLSNSVKVAWPLCDPVKKVCFPSFHGGINKNQIARKTLNHIVSH